MTLMHRISRAPVLSATFKRVSCCTMTWLFRLLHDLDHAKALVVREGARLHDPHPVPDLALVLLVVGLELGRLADDLLVAGVLLEGLDANDHGLVHAIAHDRTHTHLAHASFSHSADSSPLKR